MKSIFVDESFPLEVPQLVKLFPDDIQKGLFQGLKVFTATKLANQFLENPKAASIVEAVNAITQVCAALEAYSEVSAPISTIKSQVNTFVSSIIALKNIGQIADLPPGADEAERKTHRANLKKLYEFIVKIQETGYHIAETLSSLRAMLKKSGNSNSGRILELLDNLQYSLCLSASLATTLQLQTEVATVHNRSSGWSGTKLTIPGNPEQARLRQLVRRELHMSDAARNPNADIIFEQIKTLMNVAREQHDPDYINLHFLALAYMSPDIAQRQIQRKDKSGVPLKDAQGQPLVSTILELVNENFKAFIKDVLGKKVASLTAAVVAPGATYYKLKPDVDSEEWNRYSESLYRITLSYEHMFNIKSTHKINKLSFADMTLINLLQLDLLIINSETRNQSLIDKVEVLKNRFISSLLTRDDYSPHILSLFLIVNQEKTSDLFVIPRYENDLPLHVQEDIKDREGVPTGKKKTTETTRGYVQACYPKYGDAIAMLCRDMIGKAAILQVNLGLSLLFKRMVKDPSMRNLITQLWQHSPYAAELSTLLEQQPQSDYAITTIEREGLIPIPVAIENSQVVALYQPSDIQALTGGATIREEAERALIAYYRATVERDKVQQARPARVVKLAEDARETIRSSIKGLKEQLEITISASITAKQSLRKLEQQASASEFPAQFKTEQDIAYQNVAATSKAVDEVAEQMIALMVQQLSISEKEDTSVFTMTFSEKADEIERIETFIRERIAEAQKAAVARVADAEKEAEMLRVKEASLSSSEEATRRAAVERIREAAKRNSLPTGSSSSSQGQALQTDTSGSAELTSETQTLQPGAPEEPALASSSAPSESAIQDTSFLIANRRKLYVLKLLQLVETREAFLSLLAKNKTYLNYWHDYTSGLNQWAKKHAKFSSDVIRPYNIRLSFMPVALHQALMAQALERARRQALVDSDLLDSLTSIEVTQLAFMQAYVKNQAFPSEASNYSGMTREESNIAVVKAALDYRNAIMRLGSQSAMKLVKQYRGGGKDIPQSLQLYLGLAEAIKLGFLIYRDIYELANTFAKDNEILANRVESVYFEAAKKRSQASRGSSITFSPADRSPLLSPSDGVLNEHSSEQEKFDAFIRVLTAITTTEKGQTLDLSGFDASVLRAVHRCLIGLQTSTDLRSCRAYVSQAYGTASSSSSGGAELSDETIVEILQAGKVGACVIEPGLVTLFEQAQEQVITEASRSSVPPPPVSRDGSDASLRSSPAASSEHTGADATMSAPNLSRRAGQQGEIPKGTGRTTHTAPLPSVTRVASTLQATRSAPIIPLSSGFFAPEANTALTEEEAKIDALLTSLTEVLRASSSAEDAAKIDATTVAQLNAVTTAIIQAGSSDKETVRGIAARLLQGELEVNAVESIAYDLKTYVDFKETWIVAFERALEPLSKTSAPKLISHTVGSTKPASSDDSSAKASQLKKKELQKPASVDDMPKSASSDNRDTRRKPASVDGTSKPASSGSTSELNQGSMLQSVDLTSKAHLFKQGSEDEQAEAAKAAEAQQQVNELFAMAERARLAVEDAAEGAVRARSNAQKAASQASMFEDAVSVAETRLTEATQALEREADPTKNKAALEDVKKHKSLAEQSFRDATIKSTKCAKEAEAAARAAANATEIFQMLDAKAKAANDLLTADADDAYDQINKLYEDARKEAPDMRPPAERFNIPAAHLANQALLGGITAKRGAHKQPKEDPSSDIEQDGQAAGSSKEGPSSLSRAPVAKFYQRGGSSDAPKPPASIPSPSN